jgi:CO dehydrogenase maturation factor
VRVAIAGKGGAGKTTIAASLARLAARRGTDVLCLDADSNPNLAVALGIDTAPTDTVLPTSLVSRRLDGPALADALADVLEQHTVRGADGVRLAHMGMPAHADEGCMCGAHAVVHALLADLGDSETLTLVDMEASPEHFSRGTARHVDTLVFVVEPYFRSLETVRRMAELARELPIPRLVTVANKVRDEEDRAAIDGFAERYALPLIGSVPWDDAILDADRDRRPLVEAAPDGAAVRAIEALLGELLVSGDAAPLRR